MKTFDYSEVLEFLQKNYDKDISETFKLSFWNCIITEDTIKSFERIMKINFLHLI